MGQKTHPLGLRIQSSTRSFDNSWYSEHFFTKLISVDVLSSLYLNTFFKIFQLPFARFSIQHYPKTSKLYTFFCYPRQSREYKSKIFQIPSGLSNLSLKKNRQNHLRKQQLLLKNSIKDDVIWQHVTNQHVNNPSFGSLQEREKSLLSKFHQIFLIKKNQSTVSVLERSKNGVLLVRSMNDSLHQKPFGATSSLFSEEKKKQKETLNYHSIKIATNIESLKKVFLKKSENFDFPLKDIKHLASNLSMMSFLLLTKKKQNILENSIIPNFRSRLENGNEIMHLKYKYHAQSYISQHFKTNLKFFPFKVSHEWQDAGFFADEIVYLLERRIPFRRLKNRIFKQLALNTNIKGLRLTCSGRVGGKSKKAQRAKMDFIKYGQTSLHVFSSKIDFATRTAHTPLGSTGIKVWICYK
jgi:hypothetical protein